MEKSEAIVLRLVEFSETSLVATLYTRDFGKVGALAKGARRPKNPFDFALDLLNVCRVVFLHKSSSSLDLLTEAKLERRFRAASRDLSRFYAGLHLAEVLSAFTDYGDPCPRLFDAAELALQAMDNQGHVPSWTVWFEWALFQYTGQLPILDSCAVCGRPISAGEASVFAMGAGGLTCGPCRVGQRRQVRLRHSSIAWLRQLSQTIAAPATAAPFLDAAPVPGELHALLQAYITYLLGRPLRTAPFLVQPHPSLESEAARTTKAHSSASRSS